MPDARQLPFLVKLLDDESGVVRQAVLKELEAFGPSLPDELTRLGISLTDLERKALQTILTVHKKNVLKKNWLGWHNLDDDNRRLELALSVIAEYLEEEPVENAVKSLLDELTREYTSASLSADPKSLAHFLFTVKKFSGIDSKLYYDPQNSNLLHVLRYKLGIPISLSCVYILVGSRLKLDIRGCNFPGHFLTSATVENKKVIVDCYNGGTILDQANLTNVNNALPVTKEEIMNLECTSETIIARVAKNLANAFQKQSDMENVALFTELLGRMQLKNGR